MGTTGETGGGAVSGGFMFLQAVTVAVGRSDLGMMRPGGDDAPSGRADGVFGTALCGAVEADDVGAELWFWCWK